MFWCLVGGGVGNGDYLRWSDTARRPKGRRGELENASWRRRTVGVNKSYPSKQAHAHPILVPQGSAVIARPLTQTVAGAGFVP